MKTRSAGGVVLRDGKVIVVNQHGNSWSLPKGHVKEGESDLDAAIREIGEESGITELRLVRDLGSYSRYRIEAKGEEDRSEFKTISMFLFDTSQTRLDPKDSDNPEARWVDKKDVASLLTDPKDKEFFKSIRL